MAPRIQLEKAAWLWAQTVTPEEIIPEHVELAYRINLRACKRGTCRRNCKGNPNCLVGIGEQAWLGEINESSFHNIDDPNSERRAQNSFVGLKNLGATCYVNTFLQVWFHNLELRRTLYQYQSSRAEEHDLQSEYVPESVCEHLQYLFALLQNSNRKYIDPSPLVQCLGLNTREQQDAQEFSKLFLSLLENKLSTQTSFKLHNPIQQQFCGQISYTTMCNHCGHVSALPSLFHELELNIQGHKNLKECITEFQKEEYLEGENRYFCERCQSKQNATRCIRLNRLPPTLNLQLMRFIFDRQTGQKKKLNTFISFQEQLDMGPFLEGQQDQKSVYELSAVLIHRGISAYSGHYIAHVKDPCTGDWYKFNDEEIEKMEGKKLQLGLEEDIAETVKSQARKPKCSKGYHCSRNAYMLVYKLQEEPCSDPSGTNVEVPDFLQRLVDQDNQKFEEWCSDMAEMRKLSVDKGKAKHEEVKELYELLPAKEGERYEFIPSEWLQKWLDDSTATKEIESSTFLCAHGKLLPNKVGDVKRVSKKAADLLFKRYGGGPRLDDSSLCRECVSERCRVLRLKNQLNEDYKEISSLVKRTLSDEGYWVGKASLKCWKQLALDQLEEDDDEQETKPSSSQTRRKGPRTESSEMESTEDEMKTFNEDIVCGHGALSILETERKLVSAEVWTKLRQYFPNAPEFTPNHEACEECLALEREVRDNETVSKIMALDQKHQLLNLFHERFRPTLTSWPQGVDVLYAIPQFFVDEWKKFVRRPTKCSPVSNVGNTMLLCPHGGLMFTFESLISGDAKHVSLLWDVEWDVIRRVFKTDVPISINRVNKDPPQYTTTPDLCWECRQSYLLQQQKDLREYTQATIYIRKVIEDKRVVKEAAPELTASSSEAEEEKEEPPKVEGLKSEDFCLSEDGTKRRRLGTAEHETYMSKLDVTRRSTRHRKLRGEKALIVSANQTLKELKIQIMHAFSVAPFDQNLFIDGKILSDDSATLGCLGVVPESIICLKADEPISDFGAMDDVYQVGMPEEGFKGTGLMGH